MLESTYRLSALSLIYGFRTTSDGDALMLADQIPIHILANEVRRVYNRRHENINKEIVQKEERAVLMQTWQAR